MQAPSQSPENQLLAAAEGFFSFTPADLHLLTGLSTEVIAHALPTLLGSQLFQVDIAESGDPCYEWNHEPWSPED